MSDNISQSGRIIGLDMHPDIYSAAAVVGSDPAPPRWSVFGTGSPRQAWSTGRAKTSVPATSFEMTQRLRNAGFRTVVLESQRAGQIRDAYCNNDKSSAVKLARIYLTGMAREVWEPTR
jgi:hypothetical protein